MSSGPHGLVTSTSVPKALHHGCAATTLIILPNDSTRHNIRGTRGHKHCSLFVSSILLRIHVLDFLHLLSLHLTLTPTLITQLSLVVSAILCQHASYPRTYPLVSTPHHPRLPACREGRVSPHAKTPPIIPAMAARRPTYRHCSFLSSSLSSSCHLAYSRSVVVRV